MKESVLLVPSRGRPENIARLVQALEDTQSNIDLKVGIDEDDPKLQEYKRLAGFELVVGERKKFGGTFNEMSMNNLDYKYIHFVGDDMCPRTEKWDELMRKELEELGTGIVYGNDLYQGINIATQWAFTSDIPKTLGYAVPPGFVHLFIDNMYMELGKSIDRLVYMPSVIIEHIHPAAGKAEQDQTYVEANSSANWTNDRIRFEKYLAEELASDAAKLRKLIK